MTQRTITSDIYWPDGTPARNAAVYFRPTDDNYTLAPDASYLRDTHTAYTDSAGHLSTRLASGTGQTFTVTMPDGETFPIVVPDGADTTLELLRAAYVAPSEVNNLETAIETVLANTYFAYEPTLTRQNWVFGNGLATEGTALILDGGPTSWNEFRFASAGVSKWSFGDDSAMPSVGNGFYVWNYNPAVGSLGDGDYLLYADWDNNILNVPYGLRVGQGDLVSFYTSADGRMVRVKDGTAAAPVTTFGPTAKVSRTVAMPYSVVTPGSDGSSGAAAIEGSARGITGNQVQPIGLMGTAYNAASSGAGGNAGSGDAVGVFGIAFKPTGAITGVGIGGVFYARRESGNNSANLTGVEVGVLNYGTDYAAYSPSGFNSSAFWVHAGSGGDVPAGLLFGNPFGGRFQVGIAFNAQVAGGDTGPVTTADFRTDDQSVTVFDVNGSHTYGLDFLDATFSAHPVRLKNNTSLSWRNAAGSADVGAIRMDASNQLLLLTTGANIYLGSTAFFDGGAQFGEGDNIVAGTTTGTKIGTATNQKLGFFNASPIIQPAGVAVTAAAIHAALVSLGLIAA